MTEEKITEEKNSQAIVGFILSIIGIHIIGLIFSIIGYKKSKELNGKGKSFSIIGIIISVLGIILVTLAMVISINYTSKAISQSSKSIFFTNYQYVEKSVKRKIIEGETASCDSNCKDLYELDNENLFLTVTDKGTYYEINYMVTGKYKNITFDDYCSTYNNLECNKNVIIGKVDKVQ